MPERRHHLFGFVLNVLESLPGQNQCSLAAEAGALLRFWLQVLVERPFF